MMVARLAAQGLGTDQIAERMGLSPSRVRRLRQMSNPGAVSRETYQLKLAQSLVTAWTVWQEKNDRSQEDACRIMRDVVNQELHSDTGRLWMLMVWRLQTTNDPRGFCTSDTPGAREAFDEMLRFFDDWLGAE